MIRVSFVDTATGAVLGQVELAATQLPESFAAETTMHMSGSDWQVVRAEPMTRDEFVASGQLRLELRRLVSVAPKELLYSVPTLENTLPPLRDAEIGAAYRLHEDDWRQIELVATRFEPEIAADLTEIRAVRDEREGVGFKRLHVRARIPDPLAGIELSLAELVAALGDVARRDLAIGTSLVERGFAYAMGKGAIYGREVDGNVQALALHRTEPAPLVPLARLRGLLVVDWPAARMF